ncbi:hypothetical protein GCM10022419_071420 [Nonomuraea rosea]|uniref:Response regulator transcription factor n=1 Tax=Nonomuraea rosea TaxID=638574 RepID=A0ABP6YBQ6_9ACTN
MPEEPQSELPGEREPQSVLPGEREPQSVLPGEREPQSVLPGEREPQSVLPGEREPLSELPEGPVIELPGEPVSVLIVDDHPMFRQGLRYVLDSDPRLSVVGEAGDLAQAYALTARLRPRVVLMDLCLPDGSGLEATRRLTSGGEHEHVPAVLVLTMSDADDTVVAALRAGARGYLVKDTGAEDILRAVHTVARGGASLGPRTAERLSAFFSALHSVPCQEAFPTLTAREREILDLVARGHDNRRIARSLVLSEKTVRNHVSRLFDKLQVADRAQAVIRARDAGLGE